MRFIRNFMLVLGPVSSVFDFLTFGLLLLVFHANEALFQTGWFIESLATQVLVIFVLRTRGNPLRSRPHPLLATTSVAVVVLAVVLPFTPLGAWFGFAPPSAAFLLADRGADRELPAARSGREMGILPPVAAGGVAPAPSMRSHLPLIERLSDRPLASCSLSFEFALLPGHFENWPRAQIMFEVAGDPLLLRLSLTHDSVLYQWLVLFCCIGTDRTRVRSPS